MVEVRVERRVRWMRPLLLLVWLLLLRLSMRRLLWQLRKLPSGHLPRYWLLLLELVVVVATVETAEVAVTVVVAVVEVERGRFDWGSVAPSPAARPARRSAAAVCAALAARGTTECTPHTLRNIGWVRTDRRP